MIDPKIEVIGKVRSYVSCLQGYGQTNGMVASEVWSSIFKQDIKITTKVKFERKRAFWK